MTPSLETRDLTIRFGGHVAVNAVSCAFRPGTLTAIVGPNGAGKTTYFNLISGQLRATAGQVLLRDRDVTRATASARTRQGMGRAFQLTNLFPGLTVAENVRLAVQSRAGIGLDLFTRWSSHRQLIARADEFLQKTALTERRNDIASSLPHGDQRKLEVAILLALEPDIFMFDEPTAGMSNDDVPVILDLIRALKAERDGEIEVAGPDLAHSLTDLGLIDEYRIYLHPVVLGHGQPYFAGPRPPLRLISHDRVDEDVIRLVYIPA